MLRPGDAAPDFVLRDHADRDLRLSTFSGKPIVLYFYAQDASPACALEARRFRDHYPDIEAHGAVVVGISLDGPASHGGFHTKNGLPFPLVSDPDGRVHDLYEAWRTTLFGRTHFAVRRCTYLIDGDGIIRRVYRNVNVMGHARQVVKDLQRLAAQRSWGKPNAKLKDLKP